jgi:Kdo2-lipid IVA lauroyltransferase/acyltransferase
MEAATPVRHQGRFGLRYWPTWLVLGCMRLAALMPLSIIVLAGSVTGELLYILARERRRVAAINLAIAFPDADRATLRRLARASFRNVSIGVLEIGMVWWAPERVRRMTEIRGIEHLERAQQSGKGAMLLTAHFTGIEVGLPVLSAHATLVAMYKRPHNRLMDEFMERHRAKYTAIIAGHHAPIGLIRGLKHGCAMWYAPDQDFGGKDTVFVPLFGVEASALTAPARIAQMAGVPVMPCCIERKPGARGYRLTIGSPLPDFPSGDNERDALSINQATEALIRQNPEQYLWIHKRYKRRPDGSFGIYPPWA